MKKILYGVLDVLVVILVVFAVAVAHGLVSRLERIPKRIGRDRKNRDLLTNEV